MQKPNLIRLLFFTFLFFQIAPITGWATSDSLRIQFEENKLSAEIKGASLLKVLKELHLVTGIKFSYKNLPQIKIDQRFEGLSIENGIKKILPVSTIFLYSNHLASEGSDQNQNISSVIVFPFLKHGIKTGNGTELSSNEKPETQITKSSSLKKPEAFPFEHARYQEGVDALLHQIEESVSAYDWLTLLKNDRPEKRLEAVSSLGALGNDFAVRALYMALGDHDVEVKNAAVWELKQISEKRSFQSIKKDLNETNATIQNQALDRISQKTGKQWENLLRSNLKSNKFKGPLKPKAESLLKSLKAKN